MSYVKVVPSTRIRVWGKYAEDATCDVADCGRRPVARGVCNLHRLRLAKFGSFELPAPPPLIDRVLARLTEDECGCWIWQGAKTANGYGVVGRGQRGEGNALVHRVTYEEFISPIPDGLHLDHLCRTPSCANPWHLDPVTQAVNNQRQWESRRAS